MVRYAKVSSAELVRLCATSTDERAWAEFIRRFQVVIASTVLRTARRWGEPSRAQLDDLVQDTYLKLCENNHRLLAVFRAGNARLDLWIFESRSSQCCPRSLQVCPRRKAWRGSYGRDREPSQTDQSTNSSEIFDEVSHRLQLDQIEKILRQVTTGKDQERKRTIFWLRHRFGLTASEIASIPSIDLTTEGVESVLMRLATMIRGHIIALFLTVK